MAMAMSAKKLFEENLRYANDEPVRVVIADSTIGRVAETAACAEKFKREGVSVTLAVTPCWCYGSETMDMDKMMLRLNIVKGLGPCIQITEGWTVNLPEEGSDTLWKRTDYTWLCTWFAPRLADSAAVASCYDVINNWGANHCALSYGHIGADLISICAMLRIPVSMHNVPESEIFRLAA